MTHDLSARPEPGPVPRHVALLGAAGTGKTQLARELLAALDNRPTPHPIFLVADNPPLAAVRSARADGLSGQHGFDRVLLMGLDLPAAAGLAAAQDAVDQHLRLTLAGADVPYTVVYGQGPQRLAHALAALQGLQDGSQAGVQARNPWVWACDTCSDPACERRLLSDLLARRPP